MTVEIPSRPATTSEILLRAATVVQELEPIRESLRSSRGLDRVLNLFQQAATAPDPVKQLRAARNELNFMFNTYSAAEDKETPHAVAYHKCADVLKGSSLAIVR